MGWVLASGLRPVRAAEQDSKARARRTPYPSLYPTPTSVLRAPVRRYVYISRLRLLPVRASTIERVTIQRMEHVGIVVDDLAAAIEFFVGLGLGLKGEGAVEGGWVDRVVGLDGVRAEIALLETPDGHGGIELAKFNSPSSQGGDSHAPANTLGIRHVSFAVQDIEAAVAGLRSRGVELVGELERYEDRYLLCYVRGPEGIIVELAERIG